MPAPRGGGGAGKHQRAAGCRVVVETWSLSHLAPQPRTPVSILSQSLLALSLSLHQLHATLQRALRSDRVHAYPGNTRLDAALRSSSDKASLGRTERRRKGGRTQPGARPRTHAIAGPGLPGERGADRVPGAPPAPAGPPRPGAAGGRGGVGTPVGTLGQPSASPRLALG